MEHWPCVPLKEGIKFWSSKNKTSDNHLNLLVVIFVKCEMYLQHKTLKENFSFIVVYTIKNKSLY